MNDLVFRLKEIDWKTGFLVISDKDDNYQSKSRIVWLPPHLLRQIGLYVKHLEVLEMKMPVGSTLWSYVDDLRRTDRPEDALLFFVENESSVMRLTPENLRKQVEGFSLPVNIGRHYLRQRLRQLGCDAEYVNGFLGHWQSGQEPFGRFSSLAPVEMYTAMAPYFEKLRIEAGWTIQSGFADD